MNNRIWNCKNPYQGASKKVLCVCSAGLLRSPTAAKVLWKEYGYNTRACGLDAGHALIPIDDVLITWADEIVVMTESQKEWLHRRFFKDREPFTVISLDIEDSFAYMDENLVKAILTNYKRKLFDTQRSDI